MQYRQLTKGNHLFLVRQMDEQRSVADTGYGITDILQEEHSENVLIQLFKQFGCFGRQLALEFGEGVVFDDAIIPGRTSLNLEQTEAAFW